MKVFRLALGSKNAKCDQAKKYHKLTSQKGCVKRSEVLTLDVQAVRIGIIWGFGNTDAPRAILVHTGGAFSQGSRKICIESLHGYFEINVVVG